MTKNGEGQRFAVRPTWLSDPSKTEYPIDDRANAIIDEAEQRLSKMVLPQKDWLFRLKSGVQFIYPLLAATGRPLHELNALEVGCGTGPKAIGLAPVFKNYVGIDLDPDSIVRAERLGKALSRQNLQFLCTAADDIGAVIQGAGQKFDVIILHAVVEHLTIDERLQLLQVVWEYLDERGILYVGELPNRLCPVDHHSSYAAYFNGLPDDLALRYADKIKRPQFRERVIEAPGDPRLNLYRTGRPASFHEFELAIAPCAELPGYLRADCWDNLMLNLHPVQRYERDLLEQFRYLRNRDTCAVPPVPSAFARYWLYMVLVKRKGAERPWPLFPQLAAPGEPAVIEDAFANQFLSRTECQVSVGKRHSTLTIGLLRQRAGGSFRVENDRGDILFAGSSQSIVAAMGQHWNPHAYLSINVSGAEEVRIIADPGENICLGNVMLR
jgi:SAM-dependent methyltransferase